MKKRKLNFIPLLLALTAIVGVTGATTVATPVVTPTVMPPTVLVDPTRPPNAILSPTQETTNVGAYQLTATYIYPDKRLAVINNQFVKEGDVIGTYSVINIQRDTVELKDNRGATVILPLLPTVKTRTTVNKG